MSFTGISLGVGGGSDCVSVRGLGEISVSFFGGVSLAIFSRGHQSISFQKCNKNKFMKASLVLLEEYLGGAYLLMLCI